MRQSVLSALALAPLAAYARRHHHGQCSSGGVTVTETVTVPGGPSSAPTPTFITSTLPATSGSSTKPSSSPAAGNGDGNGDSDDSPSQPTPSDDLPTRSGDYADAQETDVGIPATEQCGDNDRLIMPGMPWTVANSMYGSQFMNGQQCTNFNDVLKASDGTLLVSYDSKTSVQQDDNDGICKGYSNVGIGKNLKEPLGNVKSIPAYFSWERTKGANDFKGSNIFDFITSPNQGAGEEPGSNEFMLFLEVWGGQVPIGYGDGPIDQFDLFDHSFKLYKGPNEDHGQTVYSLIPDQGFDGEFQGDLKVWLDTMAQKGYGGANDFVNIGNGGTEIFYGNSDMTVTMALGINL